MRRRDFVRLLSAGAVVSCPLCSSALATESGKDAPAPAHGAAKPAAAENPGHGGGLWSYEGTGAPEHWGDLSPEYRACGAGSQQSPLNLDNRRPSLLSGLSVDWQPGPFEVVNNGHTIQANAAPGNGVMLEGKRYDLLQFHFHHPSEHQVDGRPYSMEAHFVHKSAEGNLAVLGAFLTPGREHGELKKVWTRLPHKAGQKASTPGPVDIRLLLPDSRACYRYAGSLTTPPCSEIVDWLVFRDPIEVSAGQIAQFARLYPANARPVQPQHRRFILGNF
ncbi:carbonic anhydrase [Pelagibius marinus]|uniref:carbonic anhydrase n=1 Tax=Pelagibius marinus TaxID=2762760 RepID=UPI001872F07A|nr:carbonic anhydrase family protein [Pelagibius marinus]